MKTKLIIIVSILILAMLAACSGEVTQSEISTDSSKVSQSDTSADVDRQTDPVAGAMSPEMQLIVGTFLLEDTELAVDAEQAEELLLLWTILRSLTDGDTASSVERDALVNQISETMSIEQLTTIDAMEITNEDLAALAEKLGIETNVGRQGSSGTPNPEMAGQVPGGEGFVPGMGRGGGAGGGAGGGQSMEGLTPEQIATAQAMRSQRSGTPNRSSIIYMDELIVLLESKIQ